MNQTSRLVDNGLNVNYEILSAEELQGKEEYMQSLIKARKEQDPHNYALTDEEMKKRNELYFFKKLRDNEHDSAKVGDIFHTSWGYDQTNVEHFQIKEISKTGKTCKVIQIGSSTAPESELPMADSVYPDPKESIVTPVITPVAGLTSTAILKPEALASATVTFVTVPVGGVVS